MTDRKTSAPWIAGAVLLVLIGGYVGAYDWTVQQSVFGVAWCAIPPASFDKTPWTDRLFAPIHWLDRRIRPHVWEPTP